MNYLHPHYINLVWLKLTRPLYDFLGYFRARYWGVIIGGNCHFNGMPVFRTLPKSEIKIGRHCTLNSSTTSNLIGVQTPCMLSTLKRGASIKIGDNCGFSGTVIWCSKSITLGDNVRCGANTLIYDTDGHTDDPRAGMEKPIVIGNNVWLGYGVKVMKGVTIGENSLIGAGSIVTKDIPANVVAAGVPCKVIRNI